MQTLEQLKKQEKEKVKKRLAKEYKLMLKNKKLKEMKEKVGDQTK